MIVINSSVSLKNLLTVLEYRSWLWQQPHHSKCPKGKTLQLKGAKVKLIFVRRRLLRQIPKAELPFLEDCW